MPTKKPQHITGHALSAVLQVRLDDGSLIHFSVDESDIELFIEKRPLPDKADGYIMRMQRTEDKVTLICHTHGTWVGFADDQDETPEITVIPPEAVDITPNVDPEAETKRLDFDRNEYFDSDTFPMN